MGLYKVLAVKLMIGCLFFCHFAMATDKDCAEIQSKYSLVGEIKAVRAYESRALYSNLDTILDIIEKRNELKVLDMTQLKNEILKVKLCVNLSDRPLIGSGTRKGSIYFKEEQTIIFNSKELLSHQKSGPALNMLHEFLGALGYSDQNYEITSYLYSVVHVESFGIETVKTVKKAAIQHLKNSPLVKDNINFSASEGGISGVGGGGDPEIVFLKALALNYAIINIDYFNKLLNEKLDVDLLSLFIMEYKIETNAVNQFPKKIKSPYPHLFFAPIGKELGIVLEALEWEHMLELGTDGYEKRTELVRDLVSLMAIHYKQEKGFEK